MVSTTISVSEETWEALKIKKKLGQTFDDIIKEALGIKGGLDNDNSTRNN